MTIEFRRAAGADLPAMMEIVAQAQAFMKSQGLDQWQDGYPSRQLVAEDIEAGNAYVVTCQGAVHGMATLLFTGEADYDQIFDGAWASNAPYAAMHRVAMHQDARGSGAATFLMEQAIALCQKAGVSTLRIDTHPDNKPMRRFLGKHGFVHRGTIYLSGSGDMRVAYDRLLDSRDV